ncbi:hypothetical protein QN355_11740 [Cryobacterium sp. 10S3]|uniref:hypothetical protein n=1 Tax=Cryobacterium sp. 10S3 TaxID=3048582 RepID=UPI002AC955D4|nr:hypothetical protein [Cryobacterium sp. 10S3]MEB0287226.1 hypothetical protein [Cryobacterium sp. 10S3]WPX14181.1 hypothetical protein RHM57_02060 [Cryobacterium sp. 10S3]
MSVIIQTTDLNTYMNKILVAAIATQVVSAVNQWVESRTRRSWGATVQVVERYDYKPRGVFLRKMDIVSVDLIRLGWPNQPSGMSTINASSYYVNEFGRLTMLSPFANSVNSTTRFFNDLLEVTYTYGVTKVPDDLKLAALGIAAVMYNFAVNGQQNIVASSVGNYHIQTIGAIRGAGGVAPNPAMNTAEANYAIIDSYVMRRQ